MIETEVKNADTIFSKKVLPKLPPLLKRHFKASTGNTQKNLSTDNPLKSKYEANTALPKTNSRSLRPGIKTGAKRSVASMIKHIENGKTTLKKNQTQPATNTTSTEAQTKLADELIPTTNKKMAVLTSNLKTTVAEVMQISKQANNVNTKLAQETTQAKPALTSAITKTRPAQAATTTQAQTTELTTKTTKPTTTQAQTATTTQAQAQTTTEPAITKQAQTAQTTTEPATTKQAQTTTEPATTKQAQTTTEPATTTTEPATTTEPTTTQAQATITPIELATIKTQATTTEPIQAQVAPETTMPFKTNNSKNILRLFENSGLSNIKTFGITKSGRLKRNRRTIKQIIFNKIQRQKLVRMIKKAEEESQSEPGFFSKLLGGLGFYPDKTNYQAYISKLQSKIKELDINIANKEKKLHNNRASGIAKLTAKNERSRLKAINRTKFYRDLLKYVQGQSESEVTEKEFTEMEVPVNQRNNESMPKINFDEQTSQTSQTSQTPQTSQTSQTSQTPQTSQTSQTPQKQQKPKNKKTSKVS